MVAARAAEVWMVAATAVVSWVVVASVAVETEAAARMAPGRGQGTGVKGASRVGRVKGKEKRRVREEKYSQPSLTGFAHAFLFVQSERDF